MSRLLLFTIVFCCTFSIHSLAQINTKYEKGVVYLINGDSLSGYVRAHTTYKNQIKYKNEEKKKKKVFDHKQVKGIKVTSKNGVTREYEYKLYEGRKIPRLLCKVIDDELSLYYTFGGESYVNLGNNIVDTYCPEEYTFDYLCIGAVYIGKKDNIFVQYFKKDFFKDCGIPADKTENLKGRNYWEFAVRYYNENCIE